MQRDVATPKEYLACVEGDQLVMLKKLRGLVKKSAPKIKEDIKWGMLHYGNGEAEDLFALAAQKHYVSLYVPTRAMAQHKKELNGVSCGKCCIRFRKSDQIDETAIRNVLQTSLKMASGVC